MTTATPSTLESLNPATGESIGSVPITPAETINDVVSRGREAQVAWGAMSLTERINLIRPAAEAIKARSNEIGALMTSEMGKPIAEGEGEVDYAAAGLPGLLDSIASALEPEHLDDGRTETDLYYDPFGVCGVITPWNFPFLMPQQTVIPALVAGNTVVMKPSEETPLVGQAFADVYNEFLPEGVLQIIHGDEAQGKALVKSDVNLIAFVGSRAAGQHILESAGGDLKRVILELGGKDPMIVLDDADLESAADFAAMNSFRNCGQVCVSTERIYVQEGIANDFEQALLERVKDLKVGDGTDTTTRIGPMVSQQQKEMVLAQLETAKQQGATVAHGDVPMDGNYVAPTVLTGLDHSMNIMRDETFGPIACVMRVKDEGEAVKLANDTPYGLGAVVFGSDADRAKGVARQLTAGMVGINQGCGGAKGAPWVGAQQSGYGFHGGVHGHRQFTQVRIVSTPKD
ncbi:MAG: aldehyde dehydrogenase [Phycisphaerae bacterium]|nr:aldehyde dehydrogenase [Phycisphaerae bacterium]